MKFVKDNCGISIMVHATVEFPEKGKYGMFYTDAQKGKVCFKGEGMSKSECLKYLSLLIETDTYNSIIDLIQLGILERREK